MMSTLRRHAPEYLVEAAGLAAFMLVAAVCVALVEHPESRLHSLRSLASAAPAAAWTSLWIYFTAPVLGMLLAAQAFFRSRRSAAPVCPKLHHGSRQRCIFCGQPAARV